MWLSACCLSSAIATEAASACSGAVSSTGKLVGINLRHHGSLIRLSDLGLNTIAPACAHRLNTHAHVHLLLLGIVLRVLEPGAHLAAASGHIHHRSVTYVASDVVHATTSSHLFEISTI